MRKLILTGFGTGYLPVAPGSWGSAAATGVFLLAAWLSRANVCAIGAAMIVLAALSSAACLAWGKFAESAFGRKDPSQCTIDEWAGQAVALCFLPIRGGISGVFIVAAAAFVAFRILDVLKPPPARGLQNLPAGWGILTDDLVAGAYANVACQLFLRLLLRW